MDINKVNTYNMINSYSGSAIEQQFEAGKAKADGDFAAKFSSAAANTGDDKKLKSVCREMESVFLNIMLTRMRATVPKSDLLPDRSKEEIMQSMLDSEMTKSMAQAGGIGIADMLYRQLSVSYNTSTVKSQAPK